MAQQKSVTDAPKQPTVEELRQWYEKSEQRKELFKKTKDAMQLVDPTKSVKRNYSIFSKDKLRAYMKNPIVHYKDLRNLSRFLYYRSSVYRRLVWFNATMIDMTARTVIPNIDLVKGGDEQTVLKSYYKTLTVLENMNLELEFLKMRIIAWREDVAFGCAFYDSTGYFILPLDPDYCKVTGAYMTGDLGFEMNMSYFTNRQDFISWVGHPFDDMWKKYQEDPKNNLWQEMPDEYAVCLKVNIDDYEVPLVPLMSMMNSLINLSDLEDLMAVADKQQIYKLLVATIPLIDGEEPDNFAVDVDTSLEYYEKLSESLPDYAGSAISPLPLDVISFSDDQTTDVNKIENATKAVYNSAGGAQILNSSTVSGTTAWIGAIKSDVEYATASLRPQIEAYLNRFMSYHVTKPAKIKMLKVTPYTKNEVKEQMLKDAEYGVPCHMVLNTLNGFSELETLSMNFLNNNVLHINDTFTPLQSAHVQSGNDTSDSGNSKPLSELTDDGEASIDKRDQA